MTLSRARASRLLPRGIYKQIHRKKKLTRAHLHAHICSDKAEHVVYLLSLPTHKEHMQVRNAFKSTLFLKAISLIIGLLFWTLMSDSFTTSRWVTIPVCFYNRASETIEAPETIKVELRGRRSHLRHLQVQTLALHIDAQTLKPGTTTVQLTPDQLSLPATITLGEIIPHNFTIRRNVPA